MVHANTDEIRNTDEEAISKNTFRAFECINQCQYKVQYGDMCRVAHRVNEEICKVVDICLHSVLYQNDL